MVMKLSWELKDKATKWKDFQRTNGQMPCDVCKKPLYSHPQPLELTCPTMVEDCGGKWWKL